MDASAASSDTEIVVGLSSPYHSSFVVNDDVLTLDHSSSFAVLDDLSCQDHSSSFAADDDFSCADHSSSVGRSDFSWLAHSSSLAEEAPQLELALVPECRFKPIHSIVNEEQGSPSRL